MFKPKAFGISLGLLWGVWALVFMVLSLTTGYGSNVLMLVGPLHPGFAYSYLGALWMGILHFIIGYIIGHVFALVYNRFGK